jgi:hypothetical protein
MSKKLALLASLSLTACANQVGRPDFLSEQTDVAFGAAVNQNIAAQTVNPDGADGDVEASGARVGKAVARYQTDTVEKPKDPGTLSIQTGGGGEGGKGGGGDK